MAKFLERFKGKFKIKRFDTEQPIKVWLFVLMINILGFLGYFYLKINDIQLGK